MYYLTNLTIAENDSRIKFFDFQVKLTNDRFERFVESLAHKNKLIERTLYNEQRNLTAIGFMNVTNEKCVIRYGKLPELTVVQKSIADCVDTALLNSSVLFRKVNKDLEYAKSENQYIRSSVEGCSYNYNYEGVNCANLSVSFF